MSIYPSSPVPKEVAFVSVTPTLISTAHNLARQARSKGVQRWMFKFKYQPLSEEDVAPLFAFAVAQRGQYDTFTLYPPKLGTPLGTALGTPLVDGADQVGYSIDTKGWDASESGVLLARDLIKFSGHNKVYMVTEDANADGAGLATILIQPPLVTSVADEEALVVEDVPFTVSLTRDTVEMVIGRAALCHSFSLEMVEVPL